MITWSWWLLQLGTPVTVIVGITGNILSLLVLKTRRFRNKSYSHYLCSLAVFDSLVLLDKLIHRIDSLLTITGHHGVFESFGDALCKIQNFVEHVCYLMSSWLVLCMTLERFIAVKFPFKKDTLCRSRNAVTVILIVFASMSYSQIFRLIVIENVQGICGAPDRYGFVYVALHIYLYQVVLQFMLPAVLILICNLSILRKIRQLKSTLYRQNTCTAASGVRGSPRQLHKTTFMLLLVSFTYLICLFPNVFLSLLIHIAILTNSSMANVLFLKLNDFRRVLEFFSELNYAANFYIYVLSGLQFRYALRHICSARHFFISSNHQTEKVFHFRKFASSS